MATVLLIIISNQGYWFGDRPGTLEIHWTAKGDLPDAILNWELEFAGTRLAADRLVLHADDIPARITITPPDVRVRTKMRWVYHLRRKTDGALLAEGAETIHVWPTSLLDGVASRLKSRTVVVCDSGDGLPHVLDEAQVKHRVMDRLLDGADLRVAQADIILVGPDRVTDAPFSQAALLNHAGAGSSVLLFAQTKVGRLAGYPLARRPPPAEMMWRGEHPLFADFELNDLQGWLPEGDTALWAVQLPADEPALELAYWPREAPGPKPVPIDALIVLKQVGAGRLVLCQVPLGSWMEDPRSQLLLRNALHYLVTRPEPTPRPSEREVVESPSQPETPTITIPSGVKP